MKTPRRALLFLITVLALFAAILAGEIREKGAAVLQTDMQQLLPKDKQADPITLQAVAKQQEAANREVLAIVGAADADAAKRAAAAAAASLQASGLFTAVQWQFGSKLAELRRDAAAYSSYLASRGHAAEIAASPQRYARERTAQIANPFNYSLLPLSQDLLGFAADYQPPDAGRRLQPDTADGSLTAADGGKTWVLLRAQLASGGLAATDKRLPDVMAAAKNAAAAQGGIMHTAAAALFNADGRASGSREGTRLSIIGAVLTILLFIIIFGRARIMLLMLPPICGLLTGITATIALFGGIHLITLIIGTSLLGLLLDMPLHWLGKSLADSPFQPRPAMRALRRPFFASTAVTIIGYIMLLAAPLSVLKQTAVYSAFALTAAVAIAYITLPALFAGFTPRPLININAALQAIAAAIQTLRRLPKALVFTAAAILTGIGLWQSQWQDDIADWVHLNPVLLNDIKDFSRITGNSEPIGFVLTRAKTPDALIAINVQVKHALTGISSTAAISDFLRTDAEQTALKQALAAQKDADWAALSQVGLAPDAVRRAREQAAAKPNIAPAQALASPLGEPWRALYLGSINGEQTAMVRINGGGADAIRAAIAPIQGAAFVSAREQISAGFNHTKHISLELKLISYVLAALFLALLYGMRQSLVMLAIPLAAVIFTVAIMGLAGIRITAFAVFGLLLVMAIGVDYAIYAHTAAADNRARLAGMMLALITTLLTFGLLLFSNTPVVVSFGAAVSIGIFLCALLAMLKMPLDNPPNA